MNEIVNLCKDASVDKKEIQLMWTEFYSKLGIDGQNAYRDFMHHHLSKSDDMYNAWINAIDDLYVYVKKTILDAANLVITITELKLSANNAHPRILIKLQIL